VILKEKTGGNVMELTMNTKRKIIKKWHRNIKEPLRKKREKSEMKSSISPDTLRHMLSGFLSIRDEKLTLPDKTVKSIEESENPRVNS
jgi:hypothetical protein